MKSSKSSLADSLCSAMSTSEVDDTLLAKWKIQMRWRKAFLFARTGNPNLGDVLLGDVGKLRASIPQDTIVVEYALASTPPCGIMTIVAASDGIRVAEWKETDAIAIQKSIEDLRNSMECAQTMPGSTRANPMSIATASRSADRPSVPQRNASALCQKRLSSLLYDSVVESVKPHLQGMKKLIIIPSGDLANVPWAIFFDLPITVVPSLNIWNRLQTQAASAEKRRPKISVVSNAPVDQEKKRNNKPAIRDIPYSRMEALAIARAHQKSLSPFIADGKNREDFKEETKGTHILHLCAHSTFDAKFPSRSSIQLFHEPLTMSDWRELSISANLVVFSSCLSGTHSLTPTLRLCTS
jgi:CHAT domain-containing protein